MISQKSAKAAQRAAFLAEVKDVLAEAHEAAKKAFEDFAATAKRTKEGHIADVCGGAFLRVRKPSYRLRKALQELGEISSSGDGTWHISNFYKHVPDQSITASEKAYEAACAVFKSRFPDDGTFYAASYID